jgi:cellulose synthase/poly-beta-1,6-N-acetylglucosamine synthase-like glycosyltransferase
MVWVFWISVACVFYTLVGYRALLWLISRFWRRRLRCAPVTPPLSVIIVGHNEGATIGDKIRNTLAFDYPPDKLEIIVGSDGSTDNTSQVVQSFAAAGVKLVESGERRGKHYVEMEAMQIARGEIAVFTDASVRAECGVLRKMVSHFADPAIGCVSSVDGTLAAKRDWKAEHLYVSGEMELRRLETEVNSSVSLNGSLFAVRREICEGWHPEMSSDFFLALHAMERGYRSVIDPECFAWLGVVKSQKEELTRKIRTVVHGLVVFFSHLQLLNPFRYGLFSWQLISHKLFRWLLPFAFLAALMSSALLWNAGVFYKAILLAELAGISTALLSCFDGRLARSAVVRAAAFVAMGNIAALVAWWKFCRGEKLVTWEPSRRC